MSRGYTIHLCDMNKQADTESIGVRLGTICISRNIPVARVARTLGVTRTTVYNWFAGTSFPSGENMAAIEKFLKSIE